MNHHFCVLLMWKYLAKPSSDCDHCDNCADSRDDQICDQAPEHQRGSEREK
jgi:hypothetical protein